MLDFVGMAPLDNGLLHRVTNLVWTLVHDFGTRTFVLGVEYQFLAGGGQAKRTRGSKCEKRRPYSRALRGGAIDAFNCGVPHGTIGEPQGSIIPLFLLPSPPSATSTCERAFFRGLLLLLTGDALLAAAFWLNLSQKARPWR